MPNTRPSRPWPRPPACWTDRGAVSEAAIEVKEAAIGYAGRTVLRDVDLRIAPGERVAVLGRSGAGKSTLLNLVHARAGGRAALVPQGAALVRTLSVFHNVYMGRLDRHSARAWTPVTPPNQASCTSPLAKLVTAAG